MDCRQGCDTFEPDEAGRVLDRLAGLEKVILNEDVEQALSQANRSNPRGCRLAHEVMLWVVLTMGLFTEVPIRTAFKYGRRVRKGELTPTCSSLCRGRQRLGIAPVRLLFQQTVRPLAERTTPGCFYHGFRKMAFDSTTFNVPDTRANEVTFGRPRGGNGDGAFPQVTKLSLVELGTHVEIAFVGNDCHRNERQMVYRLVRHLTPEMLVMLDRGFFGYAMWRLITSHGAQILGRVPASPLLKAIKSLSDGSHLAKLYPSKAMRRKDKGGVVVRVIRYTIDDSQRTGHQQEHRLITTFMDEKTFPASELILEYHERFEEEHTFDEEKTHQDPPRPTKPTHLRSETPAGVIQEMYALSLGHFVTRALMYEAAQSDGLDPDRLSFTGCFHVLKCRLPEVARNAGPTSVQE